jgi:hypothetical protein
MSEADPPWPENLLEVRWANLQQPICEHFGVEYLPPDPDENCGVAGNVIDGRYAQEGTYPLTAVRHRAEHGTSGWYVWAGEYSDAADFFMPVHTFHLEFYCPDLVPFLALPPGWAVDITPEGATAGFNPALLDAGGGIAALPGLRGLHHLLRYRWRLQPVWLADGESKRFAPSFRRTRWGAERLARDTRQRFAHFDTFNVVIDRVSVAFSKGARSQRAPK